MCTPITAGLVVPVQNPIVKGGFELTLIVRFGVVLALVSVDTLA